MLQNTNSLILIVGVKMQKKTNKEENIFYEILAHLFVRLLIRFARDEMIEYLLRLIESLF